MPYASLDNGLLCIGNQLFERRWRVLPGGLVAVGFTDKRLGREWLLDPSEDLLGTTPAGALPDEPRQACLEQRHGRRSPVEAESLQAELRLVGSQASWSVRFTIFAQVPGCVMQVQGAPGAVPAAVVAAGEQSGIEGDRPSGFDHQDRRDGCERLRLACHHPELIQVVLQDRTDGHDNLVQELRWRPSTCQTLHLQGGLFAAEDVLAGGSLLALKLAPLPHARPVRSPVDLRSWHRELDLLGHGAAEDGEGYPWILLCCAPGQAGRSAALQSLQRALREYRSERDGRLLSNTWGDRNRDGRLTEAFIATEIQAGAALGVDVVQIDDGWQRGITANSVHREQGGVWLGFWAADPRFWEVHPERFPRGLAPIAAACRAAGLGFGLWFAPDSAGDFANWERDAAAVLGFWRDHGVSQVKIDGVKAHSRRAERNLRAFFDRVLAESNGAVTFDLDVTAETRPGYFGMPQVGPLFVENRYTDWHRWWPHATLRNLWQLARWVDPVRLRMEFLNHRRNAGKYGDDPLAPSRYRADFLFASVMVASPLGWFETSGLDADYIAQASPLVALWRRHRPELHGGCIHPIGDCPSGASWTGFCSVSGATAQVIVLRELAPEDVRELALPLAEGEWRVESLAGEGRVTSLAGGRVRIEGVAQLGFVWVRLSR